MAIYRNLYEVLGVEQNATPGEIKIAYKKKAQKLHPDKHGGDDKLFKELLEAYKILSNKEKRERYDRGEEIENGPIDEVESAVIQLFNIVISQHHDTSTNLIDVCMKMVKASLSKAKEDEANTYMSISEYNKMLNRVETTEDHNLFQSSIEFHIAGLEHHLSEVGKQIDLLMKVKDRIEHYSDEGYDPNDVGSFWTNATTI